MALVTHRHRHVTDIYVFVMLKKRQDLEEKIKRFTLYLQTISHGHIDRNSIFFPLMTSSHA